MLGSQQIVRSPHSMWMPLGPYPNPHSVMRILIWPRFLGYPYGNGWSDKFLWTWHQIQGTKYIRFPSLCGNILNLHSLGTTWPDPLRIRNYANQAYSKCDGEIRAHSLSSTLPVFLLTTHDVLQHVKTKGCTFSYPPCSIPHWHLYHHLVICANVNLSQIVQERAWIYVIINMSQLWFACPIWMYIEMIWTIRLLQYHAHFSSCPEDCN